MAIRTYKKGSKEKLSDNFYVSEFACHGSGCCSTVLIDEQLVTYLQQIRDHFGKPVTINSGYRCPTHNKNIGGATGSRHTKGQAADIAVKDIAPAEVAKYAESIGVLGIGLYETAKDGYFVHIDTRPVKSFWYGQAEAPRSTFGGAGEIFQIELSSLQAGDQGDDVKALQILLIGYGYNCGRSGADGHFGPATENAVEAFQEDNDLAPDGVAGPITWAVLLGK